MKRILVSLGALLVLGGGAYAESARWLASAPIYGAPTQNNATCYILNSSGYDVYIDYTLIQREPGENLARPWSSCPTVLRAWKSCGFNVRDIANNAAFFCKIYVRTPIDGVRLDLIRGNFEIRYGLTVLQNTPVN